jgi:hypothetical protein
MKRREIEITKELAKRLQRKFPNFKIYANKCPSRSSEIKKLWFEKFRETCPPLQPEMDIIIYECQDHSAPEYSRKIRAIEIKCFERTEGAVNQSFYKGIEQALALIQWGFDNVALWQLFDDSFSEEDLRNYGCRTWYFIHGVLKLPIDFTMLQLRGTDLQKVSYQVIQADWKNNLAPSGLLDIDDPLFQFTYTHKNPLVYSIVSNQRLKKEVTLLRDFLLKWLPKQSQGLT